MDSPSSSDLTVLARQLDMPLESVEAVSRLLDAGNTVPFLARYQRDEIGGLSAQQVSKIKHRLDRRRQLEDRKEVILKAITTRGKLTDELEKRIRDTHSPKVLEDHYLPFKAKKQSDTDDLIAKGLDPLADAILSTTDSKSVEELAADYVDAAKGVATTEEAIAGARTLIEERFSYNIELRKSLRRIVRRTGVLTSKRAAEEDAASNAEDEPTATAESTDKQSNDAQPNEATDANTPDTDSITTKPSDATSESSSDSAAPANTSETADTTETEATNSSAETNAGATSGESPNASASPSPSASVAAATAEAKSAVDVAPAADSTKDANAKAVEVAESKIEQPKTKRTSRVTASGVTLSKEARRQLRREARHRKRKRLESTFKEFFDYHESTTKIREHRILSIDRGERFRVLEVKVNIDDESAAKEAETVLVPADHPRADFLRNCVTTSLEQRVLPSLERDLRRELTERAELHAIRAFSGNLKKLLLRKPLKTRILAIAPSYRSGCNVAVLDETGKVIEHKLLQLIGTDDRKEASQKECLDMIQRNNVSVVGIGSSKGSREAEQLVGGWIQKELSDRDVRYAIVNDSGVNRYATSVLAGEELPNLNPGAREAAAIGRRLIDPLSELVKVEPGAINVGTYPEEMKAKPIQESLGAVVFDCVNDIGVDLNSSSKALLRNVAGLNQLSAQRICEHREKNGPFKSRAELANVDGLNEAACTQAIGFLRVVGAENPLDETTIHPDHYATAEKILEKAGASLTDLRSYFASARVRETPSIATQPKPAATESTAAANESDSKPAEAAQSDVAPEPDAPKPDATTTTATSADEALPAKAIDANADVTTDEKPATSPTALEAPSSEAPSSAPAEAKPAETNPVEPKPAEPAAAAGVTAKPEWDFAESVTKLNPEELATELGVGKFLVENLLAELSNPGFDLRSDNKGPTLRKGAINFESLSPGMSINGTVSNVVDFGVFVDIGLKEAGLVHISRMADHFIRDPNELFSAGQSLQVWVVEVDEKKRRVALTAIDPDAESSEAKPKNQRSPAKSKSPRGQKSGRGQQGRGQQGRGQGNRRGDKPRTFKPKNRRPPKPVKPITESMIDGKEPMRTFSDLLQFADKKRKGDDKKPKG